MKKFLAALCAATLLFNGCGGDKTVEQPAPPAQAEQKNFYSNGEFKIGADLSAGEYIAIGTGYVELTRNADDGKRQIIVNANLEGTNCYFDVLDGEYIKVTQDVKLYPSASAPALEVSDTLPSGHYKIGKDAKGGEYKITLEAGGYFEVTKNTRHEGIYIVKNEFTNEGGSFYATVLDGQYLQIRKGTGEFVGVAKPQVTQPVQKAAPAPVQPAAPAKVLNLGMTLEQFKAAYNATIAEYAPETGWDISSTVLTYGQHQDVLQYQFNPNVSLVGTIEKDTGLIKDVGVFFSPQSQVDAAMAFLAYSLTIMTLSPELNLDQRSLLLSKLKLRSDKMSELENSRGTAVVGNIRYTTQFSKGTFLFTASAKDI